MKTIGSVLDTYKGIGPGFDFLRVALAMMVVFNHSFLVVEGNYDTLEKYKLWTIFGSTMPMFFALSGFLITGSAGRLKLKDFLLNRGLRIVPALAVDIFISALVIGAIVSTLPLSSYYTDKKFFHYFLNIVGFIHYELPGVFLNNPFPGQVNGSLWTVPFEIGCYMIMSLMIIGGAAKSKSRMLGVVLGFTAFYYACVVYFDSHPALFAADTAANHYINNFVSSRGNYLYFDFIAGAVLYVFRDRIPYSGWLVLACLVPVILSGMDVLPLGIAKPSVLALPFAYITVYIGLRPIPKLPLYSRGDYSYGIYLYGYPIQQLLVMLFPGKFAVVPHAICSIMAVTCVAIFSWHCIEKPTLRIRKKFSFTARKGDENVALPSNSAA